MRECHDRVRIALVDEGRGAWREGRRVGDGQKDVEIGRSSEERRIIRRFPLPLSPFMAWVDKGSSAWKKGEGMGKEGGKEGRHLLEENTRWMLAISLKGKSLF